MIFVFECKKLIQNRLVIISVLFAIVLNAITSIASIQEFPSNDDISNLIQYEEYNKALSKTIQRAYGNLMEYDLQEIPKDAYMYYYQEEIITRYDALRTNVNFTADRVKGWSEYFNYSVADIMSIIMVILFSTIVVVQDTKVGFSIIQRTTKNGKTKSYIQKLFLTFILILVIVFILWIETGLLFQILYGFNGSRNAIQVIPDYLYCPYNITIREAIALFFMLKIITLMLVGAIVVTAGVFLRSYSISWIIGCLFTGGTYLLCKVNGSNWFNPFNVITGKTVLIRYQSVNLFGHPLDNLLAIILSYILLISILCVVSYFRDLKCISNELNIESILAQRMKHISKKILNSHKKNKNREHHFSIVHFEIYKLLVSSHGIFIILLFVLAKIVCVNTYSFMDDSTGDLIYREYMKALAGELNIEKEQFICNERTRIDDILWKKDNMKVMYDEGSITRTEYSNYLSEYYETQGKNQQFTIIEEQYNVIKQTQENRNSAVEPWFVYDTGWKKIMEKPLEWSLWAAIIILFSSVFSVEYQKGSFANIMRTTCHGRNYSYIQKKKIAIIGASFVALIWYAIEIICIFHSYDMPMSNAPIQSILHFREIKYKLSIIEYIAIQYSIQMIYSVMLACITTSISAITKKRFPCMVIVMILSVIPIVLPGKEIYGVDDYAFLRYFSGALNMNHIAVEALITGIYMIGVSMLSRISKTLWCGRRKKGKLYEES